MQRAAEGGEETVLTVATSKSKSLRSTIPISIVRQFRLREGDHLEWQFEPRNGDLIIVVKPKPQAGTGASSPARKRKEKHKR